MEKWNEKKSLRNIMKNNESRWKMMNVMGKVVKVIREYMCKSVQAQG
jgi:hypothetical protein